MPRYSFSLPWAFAAVVALAAVAATRVAAESDEQCMGKPPMESVATFLGMELDYETADRICCNNHRYAEPQGYHEYPEVDFYSKLDPTKETVFYDSVCGIPLFVAPRGRTFDEFVEESLHHGWPSFRPAEIVSENVIIHPDGRMESKCLTHLGHNLPTKGDDRYCIDLVCMAGVPILSADNSTTTEGMEPTTTATTTATVADVETNTDGIISASEFDAATYESSAEIRSGKHPHTKQKIGLAVGVPVALLLSIAAGWFCVKRSRETKKNQDSSIAKQEQAALDEGTNSENGGSV